MAWRAWLPDRALKAWQSVALGVGLAGAAAAIRLALDGPLGRELPYIAFFPALIVASALGGVLGGLTCLAAATAAAAMLLVPPGASSGWTIGSFWIAGALIVVVAAALSGSVRELRRARARFADAEARLQTLVGELAHRNRNALFVIMAIVSQSARSAQSAAEAERIINARLEALLRAQEVVLGGGGEAAFLRLLVDRALEPFDLARFEIIPGPEVRLEGDVAIGLGLLFHELATNALKYGALSAPKGRVRIGWTAEGAQVRFSWREVGGPAVPAAPGREGFGARLLANALVPQGGKAERRFEPDGLVCELLIPAQAPPAPAAASEAFPGSAFAREVRTAEG